MRFLAIFLFLFPALCLGQLNMDSLWGVWNDQSQPDTLRLNAIKHISWDGYIFTQPDSAFYFAQLHFDFAKKKNLKKQMADALNTQGVSFAIRGNYKSAIHYYSKSLRIREEIGFKRGVAVSLNNIGGIYKEQGDYAQAIDCYSKSLKIKEEIGDKKGIARSLGNIGGIYYSQGDYAQAIDYYSRSLKIKEEIDDTHGIARSLGNIAIIYYDQKDYDKAMDYFSKSHKIDKELGNKHGIANYLNHIGLIYQDQGNYAQAIKYHFKSLRTHKEIGDQQGIAMSLNNIGNIYKKQSDYSQALGYCSQALSIAQEVGAVPQTRDAAKSLWDINKALGRFKEALTKYEIYIETRDSLQSEENQKEVIRQEYKYQYEKQAAADSVKAAEAAKVKDAQLTAEKAENKRHKLEAQQQRQQKYFLYGGLGLALVFGGFIFNRFRITRKQKGIIEEQKERVDEAYEELGEKNQEILDSINYAQRIQSAILPPQKLVKEYIPESFILYKPKDIVAGDFYWMEPQQDGVIFAAADCTGHGVPGAMVSVVCNNGLNRSVREYGLQEPAKILDKTRELVIAEFEKSEEEVKDGMDIALVALKGNQLQYAGAHNPLWIIRNGAEEIEEIKADKQPIGKFGAEKPFTNHTVQLQKGDSIYIFSDGYADQFGGEKGKKFKSKNFKKLLLSFQSETMERQRQIIEETFENWKGDIEQLDDVCVIGVRI